jgi:hypothetical protein
MEQICAQGKNMSEFVKSSIGWNLVSYDGGKGFPTWGYETTTPAQPMVLQVDTTTANATQGAGVVITYTRAGRGIGAAKVT